MKRFILNYFKIVGIVVLGCMAGSAVAQSQKITAMAYNIRHGCDVHEQLQLRQIAKLIRNSRADIVGLVEVDSVCNRSDKTDQATILGQMTGMHAVFVRHFPFEGGAYGLALLSRFPITDIINKRIPIMSDENADSTRALLVAQLELSKDRRLQVVVAHLDYRTEISRVKQAHFLSDLFKNKSEPVMILGDLNAAPDSEPIQILKADFVDANDSNKKTYPSDAPRAKIDYILVNKSHFLKTIKDTVYPVEYSDHRPIVAELTIAGK